MRNNSQNDVDSHKQLEDNKNEQTPEYLSQSGDFKDSNSEQNYNNNQVQKQRQDFEKVKTFKHSEGISFEDEDEEQQQDPQNERNKVDVIFDSSNEYCKSIVREIFHFSSQIIDGCCAAVLHALQSRYYESYYVTRRQRLMSGSDPNRKKRKTTQQFSISHTPELKRDKLLEIYLSKSLLSQNLDTFQHTPEHQHVNRRKQTQSFSPAQIQQNSLNQNRTQEELVKYVKDYFKNYELLANRFKPKQSFLLKSVQKSIKSILAVVSFWVPDLFTIIQKQNIVDPMKHVYTKLVDSFRGDQQHAEDDQDLYNSQEDGNQQNSQNEKIMAEIVISPDHLTNGFLEDAQLVIQLFIDQFFLTMRIMVKRGFTVFTYKSPGIVDTREQSSEDSNFDSKSCGRKIYEVIKNSLIAFFSFTVHRLFLNLPQLPRYIKVNTATFLKDHVYKYYWPSLRMLRQNVDNRTIKQMITKSGFQYQDFEVETEDGYIINMNRINNKEAFKVVYFQHGVMDNSFTWVVHGPSDSVAYQAHEEGYDVFLGNFRGIYPRKLAPWKDPSTYWDYNIDHFSKYDIPAFIEKIVEVKTQELRKSHYRGSQLSEIEIIEDIKSKLEITYIGHSLGGMTLPMYVIWQKIRNRPHYLKKAILLSPAGIHYRIPLPVKVFGWIFSNIVGKFTDHLALPNIVIDCCNKIHKDIKSLPATSDLMTYLTSKVMGGKAIGDTPIGKSAKLMTSMLLFGFPLELVDHFYYSLHQAQKFQAFDYGNKEKNLKVYGSATPLNYLDHYHLIDIDIHYFISMNDFLIRADDIIEHYNTLKKHSPKLAHLKVFEGYSHIDFTYQSHHAMIMEILQALKQKNQ
eukprot:403353751